VITDLKGRTREEYLQQSRTCERCRKATATTVIGDARPINIGNAVRWVALCDGCDVAVLAALIEGFGSFVPLTFSGDR